MQRQDSHRVTRRGSSPYTSRTFGSVVGAFPGSTPHPGFQMIDLATSHNNCMLPYRCTSKFWGDSDTRISGIPPNVNLLTTQSTPLTRSQWRWPTGLFDPFEFVYTIGTCSGKFLAHTTSRFPQGDATRELPPIPPEPLELSLAHFREAPHTRGFK